MLADIRQARAEGRRADEATAERRARPDALRRSNPYYRVYETQDGYIALACLNNRLRRSAARVLGIEDPRVEGESFNVEHLGDDETLVLSELIIAIFSHKTTEEWVQLMDAAGVPCGAVKMTAELFDDPHVMAENMLVELEHPVLGTVKMANSPLRMSGGETGTRRSSPSLGQHTREYLGELGFSDDEIVELEAVKVVRTWAG
jgi:formyl-CoA transferase